MRKHLLQSVAGALTKSTRAKHLRSLHQNPIPASHVSSAHHLVGINQIEEVSSSWTHRLCTSSSSTSTPLYDTKRVLRIPTGWACGFEPLDNAPEPRWSVYLRSFSQGNFLKNRIPSSNSAAEREHVDANGQSEDGIWNNGQRPGLDTWNNEQSQGAGDSQYNWELEKDGTNSEESSLEDREYDCWQAENHNLVPNFSDLRTNGPDGPHGNIEPLGSRQLDSYIPIHSLYIARSLDLKGLIGGPFRNFRSHLVRNNVIIRFPDRTDGPAGTDFDPNGRAERGPAPRSERYLVAFQYGSAVFLNFEGEEQEVVLDMLRPFCTDHFREAKKDDYGVVLRPSLAGWSEGGQDHVLVRQLDMNNIRVIASVLGQSVALDFYAKKVDEMVNTFSELNRGMEKTGTFTMKRKKLFQLVAAANTTLADVILRLGLLERSDTAWKHAQYAKIWEYLRDDFELDERFESLDFKLNIIQHNVRFFLDILQNRKSDTLEWIIILLIAGEICVSLYEIISKAMETSSSGAIPGASASGDSIVSV